MKKLQVAELGLVSKMKKIKTLERLEESFGKLPSVGKRSAERMALAIIEMSEENAKEFSAAINEAKSKIHKCPICGNYTDEDICEICSDSSRDHSILMVVSSPKDIMSIEASGEYNGLYHSLGGTINLTHKIGIKDIDIEGVEKRVNSENIKEVIIATNPTIDGETTALYISKLLKKYKNLSVSRIAYGLPMGGNLDYVDSLTLSRAIEGRRKI